jgi:hypothetical protein
VAAGVAGLLICPLWFAMDCQGAAYKETAALQSRQNHLCALGAKRGCAKLAPTQAAPAQTQPAEIPHSYRCGSSATAGSDPRVSRPTLRAQREIADEESEQGAEISTPAHSPSPTPIRRTGPTPRNWWRCSTTCAMHTRY